jgi:hypothetical protein
LKIAVRQAEIQRCVAPRGLCLHFSLPTRPASHALASGWANLATRLTALGDGNLRHFLFRNRPLGVTSLEPDALPLRITTQLAVCGGQAMKTTISMAMFLTALSITPMNLVAQSTGSPAEKDFVSGGKVRITLESGDYDIRASADNRIHVRWNQATRTRVKLTTNGNSADLRVENTPNNFHATIEVPALTDLRIRLTAGNLAVAGIKGDKDIEANAGNLNISVGSSSDWGDVDASVTAGDINASPFRESRGGLFRSFHWQGPGKYRLHVHVMAGDVNLRN